MAKTTSRFTAADDLLHDLGGLEHGRESLFWIAPLPEEGLLINCYAWRTEATGLWGRIVTVAGPDPQQPVLFDVQADFELDGDDLDACTIGDLRVRQPTPLKVAELAFDGDGVSFDVRFEGLHEPFSYHENETGCPSYIATDRYEQSCRITGTLTIGDRTVQVDSYGQRDHSWGARDWRALQHWKWINATAGDDLSIHAFVALARGETLINGYVSRDGVTTPITAARTGLELDERMMHQRITLTMTDEQGRETTFDGRSVATYPMAMGHHYLNEAAMTATIDDRPAVAHVELGWPTPYIDAYTDELS